MKISVSLLLLSLGLAFGAGYIALQVRQSEGHAFQFSTVEIDTVKRKFREKNHVVDELNSAALFPPLAGSELLDPRLVLTPRKGQSFSSVASYFRADRSCEPNLITDKNLTKLKTWISYRCGQSSKLPPRFFEEPPYLSPFGVSFAKLAFTSAIKIFQSPEWLQQNVRYFHALELSSLQPTVPLDSKKEVLRQLNADELLKMTLGQSWIRTSKYILARRKSEPDAGFQRTIPATDFLVYNRTDWDRTLGSYGIETNDGGAGCSYRDDGLCWKRAEAPKRKIQWSLTGLFILSMALLVFCVLQIVKSLKNQRREEERKRFALQALTHELRTPLASLVITSDQLVEQFDTLPGAMKEPVLRMADDVQRLARVAETSRHYLSSSDTESLVVFDFVKIPSINEFISEALERYSDVLTIHKLKVDQPFTLDRYWIGVCLQNLVQNALQHGVAPVEVRVTTDADTLVISVTDAGKLTEPEVKNISKPFFKRTQSPGLGLGLAIVKTVTAAMNAQVQVSTGPTRFELRIGDRP